MIAISRSKIQNGGFNVAAIFDSIRRYSFKLHENEYKMVFEVVDYDSKLKNEKIQMADIFE